MSETEVAEKRLWAILLALVFAMGGWWLQNQYGEVQLLDNKLIAFMVTADQKFVQKEYLEVISREQLRRLERIEEKLDNLVGNGHGHEADNDRQVRPLPRNKRGL